MSTEIHRNHFKLVQMILKKYKKALSIQLNFFLRLKTKHLSFKTCYMILSESAIKLSLCNLWYCDVIHGQTDLQPGPSCSKGG